MTTQPAISDLREILSASGLFSPLDSHFAMFIGRLAKNHNVSIALAGALVSRSTGLGNICLDLAEYAGKELPSDSQKRANSFVCPVLPDWTGQLLESGIAGQDAGNTPLVIAGSRLYLRRYWEYENTIIRFIWQRAGEANDGLDYMKLGSDLKRLFPPAADGDINWQQVAAIAAVTRSFCVISGGPGTGKTSTVARILALICNLHDDARRMRILLGAPTGKAASRLQQAITDTGLLQTGTAVPLQATTLHRMLGSLPNSPYFRHNTENPLAADIVVIDEASMVDLPLMAKLMQAIPAATRLILLGDRHQLASVQPGSVLGDLCRADRMLHFSRTFCQRVTELTGRHFAPASFSGTQNIGPGLQDSFVELTHSYRFAPDSGIARLSRAVRDGDGNKALDLLLSVNDGSVAWSEIPNPAGLGKKLQGWPGFIRFAAMQRTPTPDFCFKEIEEFSILCALRSGPFGMERVNALLEQDLACRINADHGKQPSLPPASGPDALPCRPVMVTRNDYSLQLFNGDIGIILPAPDHREDSRVFFREETGGLRHIAPALLPDHETFFAMTVHKSQGSEYDRILLILPDQDSPLLTRELLYTAITRARESVEIWGRKEIFMAALQRNIQRASGLTDALRDEVGQDLC